MAYDQTTIDLWIFGEYPLFETTYHEGFNYFISGICLNILSSEIMVLLEEKPELGLLVKEKEVKVSPFQLARRWAKYPVPVLIFLQMIANFCAWFLPMF